MKNWSYKKSSELFGMNKWGKPFFQINEAGNVELITPQHLKNISTPQELKKHYPHLDLYKLMAELKDRGLRSPILLRFPDILKERISLLSNCFNKAIDENKYSGKYCGVFPVKVNQQNHIVQDILKLGAEHNLGLECGSKPELLIALAETNHEDLIICNGFKDTEYIEMALLSKKMGKNIIIVVDREKELDLIINGAKKFKMVPSIGFRVKLSTKGAGRWVESSGNKSKFGLNPTQIVAGIEKLKQNDLITALDLIHFHIGSQVPSIHHIKSALKEGARFFVELFNMGVKLSYIDVGGGLGIDYDGTGSSDSSTNYSEQEYANDVVYTLQSICDEKNIPYPNIITESGRALVAHSSVLVFDVLGCNKPLPKASHEDNLSPALKTDHQVLRDLNYIIDNVSLENLNESYNDLVQMKKDVLQLFTYGVLSLEQRGRAEEMITVLSAKILKILLKNPGTEFLELRYELETQLCETYFCNFSIFQSLPDAWAMGQLFPLVPLHRHNEAPKRRAILVDLTCDSDGKIENFIDPTSTESQNYIEVHDLIEDESYYMGAFLIGAYQEILGDLHNLFGDTDAVHIKLTEDGFEIEDIVKGDSIADVLSYVEYKPRDLIAKFQKSCEKSIKKGLINAQQARHLVTRFENSMYNYTYLSEEAEHEETSWPYPS